MRKPTALGHSAAAVAAVLAVIVSADAVAYNRTPAPTGAPPASTTAPTAPSTGMPAGPGSAAAVPANERNFVTMAASSGMLEVDASRLALERSKDPQVRTFAQRMVDDHSKANAELKMVAKKAGLADVPSTMTSTHNGHLERLRALSGQSFDREYAAQVGVAAHTEAVALFDKASRDLVNSDIRAFAGATLPKLQEHLKQSQSLARSVGVSDDRMKAAGAPPDAATSSTIGTTGTTGSDTTSRTTGSGAGSTMGSSGTTGGSTSDTTTGTSGTGTSGGTGTGAPKSSTGK